jgi:hypothetical protein
LSLFASSTKSGLAVLAVDNDGMERAKRRPVTRRRSAETAFFDMF